MKAFFGFRPCVPIACVLAISLASCHKSSSSSPAPAPTSPALNDSTALPVTDATPPLEPSLPPAPLPSPDSNPVLPGEAPAADTPTTSPVVETPPTAPSAGGVPQPGLNDPQPNPVVDEPGQPIPTPEPPVVVPSPAELVRKETQFWVYAKIDSKLVFNTPWDEESGDAIERDVTKAPPFAAECLRKAEASYETLAAQESFKARLETLRDLGSTLNLTFLIVVAPAESDRSALRRLDRDAYFWHWNGGSLKPALALSQFKKGTWVWEVIASPESCLQPNVAELGRYLDYAVKRLSAKGVKL